jgi:multidrug efflux pump subunit AcrB
MYFRIVARNGNPLRLDLDVMRDFVDDHVRPRMERAPGVSEISIGGGASRQVRIHVDPALLAERGLTLPDVRDAIRERNRDSSGGDIDSGKRRYYTPRSVERAARANGFRIVDSHTISLQNRVPYRFYLAAMPIQRRGSRRDVLRDS